MIEHLLDRTVQHKAREDDGTTDAYGNLVPKFAAAAAVAAIFYLEDGSEQDGGDRDAAVHRARMILSPTVTVTAYDRFVVDGQTWEVDGPPVMQRTILGDHHIELRLRWVEGA